jgi:hypothetical protein
MKKDWGYHLLGFCAVLFGITTLLCHQFNLWEERRVLGNGTLHEIVLYATAVAYVIGGALIQFPRTLRSGAMLIGAVVGLFAILQLPEIAAKPRIYTSWGNLFETLGILCGALFVLARTGDPPNRQLLRFTQILFGVCAVSFALEQAFYLPDTASLVPKWLPPGQMFWAVFTTVAFALGAVAILSGRYALLAAQLMTAMIAIFGITIWIPTALQHPSDLTGWAGVAQNFAIGAGAWILADSLGALERYGEAGP